MASFYNNTFCDSKYLSSQRNTMVNIISSVEIKLANACCWGG